MLSKRNVNLDSILKWGNWKGTTNFCKHYFKEVVRCNDINGK